MVGGSSKELGCLKSHSRSERVLGRGPTGQTHKVDREPHDAGGQHLVPPVSPLVESAVTNLDPTPVLHRLTGRWLVLCGPLGAVLLF